MEEKLKVRKYGNENDDEAKELFMELNGLSGGLQVYKLSNVNDDRIDILKLLSNRFMLTISTLTFIVYSFIAFLLILYK